MACHPTRAVADAATRRQNRADFERWFWLDCLFALQCGAAKLDRWAALSNPASGEDHQAQHCEGYLKLKILGLAFARGNTAATL